MDEQRAFKSKLSAFFIFSTFKHICKLFNMWTASTGERRRTRRGGRGNPSRLQKFQDNSVFRASASCSKILNDKKYLNAVKNFRAALFFRASASCSKILNVKSVSIQWKISGKTVFQGKPKLAEKSWMVKNIFNTPKNLRANSVFQGKRKCLKTLNGEKMFNTLYSVYIHLVVICVICVSV